MKKIFKNPIIIIIITAILSWTIWTTTSIYEFGNTKADCVQVEKQNNDIVNSIRELNKTFEGKLDKLDNKLDDVNNKIQLNYKNMYNILLEIQKRYK